MNVIMQICSCVKLLPVLLTLLFAFSTVNAKKVAARLGEACDFQYLEGRGTSYFLPDDFARWDSVTNLVNCCEHEEVPGCTPCPERESMLWTLEVENSNYIACTAVPESFVHVLNARRNASSRRMNGPPLNSGWKSGKGNVRKTQQFQRQVNPDKQRSDRVERYTPEYAGIGFPMADIPWDQLTYNHGNQRPPPPYLGSPVGRNTADQRSYTQNDCKPPMGLDFDDYYQPYPLADGPNVFYGGGRPPGSYAPNQQGIGYPYRNGDQDDPDRPPQARAPYKVNDDADGTANLDNRQMDGDYIQQQQENTYYRRNISPNSRGISERKKRRRRRPRKSRRQAPADYVSQQRTPY